MNFDSAKLRGRIRTYFSTQAAFAQAMEMSDCTMSLKLNGRTEWTAGEIRRAGQLLDIPADKLHLYFFYPIS